MQNHLLCRTYYSQQLCWGEQEIPWDCYLKQETQVDWLHLNNDIVALQCFLCSCLSDFCKLVLEVMMIIVRCTWNWRQCEQYLDSLHSGLEMEDTVPQLILTPHASSEWGWKALLEIMLMLTKNAKSLKLMKIPKVSTMKKPFPSMQHVWNLVL